MKSELWNHCCGNIAVESLLWSHCCGIIAVESLVWKHCCGIIAVESLLVESLLWNHCCGIIAVEEAPVRHLEAPRGHPGGTQGICGIPGGTQGHPEHQGGQRSLGGKVCQIMCVFSTGCSRPTILPQRERGDPHDLRSLCTKVYHRRCRDHPADKHPIPKKSRQNPYRRICLGSKCSRCLK